MRRNCFSIINLSQIATNKPYIYYDVTPDGENNEWNCVCRAITLASNLPYRKVERLLEKNACINKCDKLTVACYDSLLENYFGYKRYDINYKYTVQEVADMFYDNTVLMRIDGHLTCSIKGNIIDIFDCTKSLVNIAWVVK